MRRALPLLFLLLLAVPVTAEESVEELVARLGGEDSNQRVAALNRLRALKDPRAVGLVLESIDGFEYMGRYYGVLLLDSYPPEIRGKAFRVLVEKDDPYLEFCGATTLVQLGDRRYVDVAVAALRAEGIDSTTRMHMMNRLHMVDDPRILAAVRGFVVPGEDLQTLGYALYHLHLKQYLQALDSCRYLLTKDSRPGARAMAAAFLVRFGRAEYGGTLAETIASGEVGYGELSRVKNMLEAAQRAPEAVLEAFTGLLETEENASVLRLAVEITAKFHHRPAYPLIRKFLDHKDRLLSKAAFEALAGEVGALDPESLRPLLESEDPERRVQAADALRRMDDFAGLDAVLDVLTSGNTLQRGEAAKALGGFREERAVEPLLGALMDEASNVRMYAATSLAGVLNGLFPYRRVNLAEVGYAYGDPEPARKAAVERIRKWWQEHRDGDW